VGSGVPAAKGYPRFICPLSHGGLCVASWPMSCKRRFFQLVKQYTMIGPRSEFLGKVAGSSPGESGCR